MSSAQRPSALVAVVMGALVPAALISTPAAAQTKDAAALKVSCVQASDKAQQLRVSGKLVAAREALRMCVQEGCPPVVREACNQWFGEVTASLPTIVIGAKESDGRDILDLKVSIDGALVTEHLGGLAVPIDPGRHKMRYEKADGAVVEEDILVGEGTHNREVSVVFPATSQAAAAAVPPSAAATSGSKGPSTGNTVAGSVFAVVGAGALAGALGLDLATTSSVNADKAANGCAGHCSASTVNGYQLDYDLAGVMLGVGVVAVGVAVYVFLAHPFGTPQNTTSHAGKATFRVVPSPHGSGFAVSF